MNSEKKLFNEYIYLANIPYRKILEIIENNNSILFNNIKTDKIETRDVIIRKSLADALEELENLKGIEIKNWQWGEFHKAIFKHPFNGVSTILDKYINVGPFSVGGRRNNNF
jgi:penicillin G amidase